MKAKAEFKKLVKAQFTKAQASALGTTRGNMVQALCQDHDSFCSTQKVEDFLTES